MINKNKKLVVLKFGIRSTTIAVIIEPIIPTVIIMISFDSIKNFGILSLIRIYILINLNKFDGVSRTEFYCWE